MNRRTFIKAGAAVATGCAGIVSYTAMVEPHWLEITTRDLVIANLPAELNGAMLAHVSDLHACSYVDEDYLTSSLDRIAALSPAIVVCTGDFVTWEGDRTESVKLTQLSRVLSHFPKGRITTVAVLGNHDYGHAWREWSVADKISSVVERHGVRVLRNDVLNAVGLDIIGIDDLWSRRANTADAFKGRSSNAAIALTHNPDSLDELSWNGYSGWILAGHTHGGQCKPPFLPPPLLPVKNKRYVSGEIAVDDHRKLYISRGVGHLLQVRFNVRPEIAIFTLRPA